MKPVAQELPPNNVRVLLWLRVHKESPAFFIGQRSPEHGWYIDAFSYAPSDEAMVSFEAKWDTLPGAIMGGEEKQNQCQLPPSGWVCTRGAGHDGPCAAVVSLARLALADEIAKDALEMADEVESLTVQLVTKENEIYTLRATISALEGERDALNEGCLEYEKEITALRQKVVDAKEQLRISNDADYAILIHQDNFSMGEKVVELTARIATLEAGMDADKARLDWILSNFAKVEVFVDGKWTSERVTTRRKIDALMGALAQCREEGNASA